MLNEYGIQLYHLLRILFLFFTSLTIIACVEKESKESSSKIIAQANISPISQTASTKEMTKLIKEIQSKINPIQVSYFENGKRANMMRKRYESTNDPDKRLQFKMYYGLELINAGKNENAIIILSQVVEQLRPKKYNDIDRFYSALRGLAIAYLRVAEIQNCLDETNPKMCLMPLAEEAQFKDKQNLKFAINVLNEMLSLAKVNKEEAIWLLNFAHMAAGTYPSEVQNEYLIPPKSFESEHNLNTFVNVAANAKVNSSGLAGGCVMDDYNNDGFLDILASSWDLNQGVELLINNGKGEFVDNTAKAGLRNIVGGLNIRQVDYNNDGFLDIFIMRGAWFGEAGRIPNSLFKNMGNGTFSDVTKDVGLLSYYPTQTCIWRDFNFDGFIDLFIANESNKSFSCPNEFYLQSSDGKFSNVIHKVKGLKDENGFVKGCAAGDFNNDGLEDIYFSYNDAPNKLFLNTSKDNIISFKDMSSEAKVSEPIGSFPTWFWDYDNDGWEDILVAEYGSVTKPWPFYVVENYLGKSNKVHTRIYKNNRDNSFTEVSEKVGVSDAIFAMGANYGDLDNDGFQDFYLATGSPNFTSIFPNRMFRNNQGKSFQDVTTSGGFGHLQKGHGVSFGDIDNDGDQDVFCVLGGAYQGDIANNALFENPGNDNSFLTLKLIGDKSNKAAIGARVKLVYTLVDGTQKVQYLTVNSGSSFGANSLQLECGLSTAKQIDSVVVSWPNKQKSKSTYQSLELNSFYKLYEKDSKTEVINY